MATITKSKPQRKKPGEFSVNTIIGPGSFVHGDIETSGFTRVDGNIKGNLNAKGRVVIGESARMRSSIAGTSITVGGVVDGNILASERLIVLPSAMIIGDIFTRRLEAAEGCMIHGRVRVCQNEESWERSKSEFRYKRQSPSQAASSYMQRN